MPPCPIRNAVDVVLVLPAELASETLHGLRIWLVLLPEANVNFSLLPDLPPCLGAFLRRLQLIQPVGKVALPAIRRIAAAPLVVGAQRDAA